MEADDRPVRKFEVCTGPDCSLSGGPAALMEIEELAMESACRFRVDAGGCRDFCSMGPNIYCDGSHFGKIRSPEDCERIAKAVGMWPNDREESSSSRIGIVLTKKANRSRWQILRKITRQNSRGVKMTATWRKNLEEVHVAEIRAGEMFENAEALRQRADRRFKRLGQMIDEL
jgi:hypothetical protein